jgi:hypothetical protein
MDLTVSSFFHYYMFDPVRAEKHTDRILATITTIALGVLSLGIAHLVCYFALYNSRYVKVSEPQEQQGKINDVYRRVIDFNPDDASLSSWEISSNESADDEGVDPFVEDQTEEEPKSADSSPHVSFKTPQDQAAVSKQKTPLVDENAVNTGRTLAAAHTRLPVRRESRLVRYLSERRLKKEKKGESQKKELKRSFSLKNMFHALKRKK